MFGWLGKMHAKPLQPESRWIVAIGEDKISVTDHTGTIARLAKSDLASVVIETNDSGPWGTDLWWLLIGADGQLGCAAPGGATGETELLDYLTALPRFDYQEMTRAMASTDNARFRIWEKTRSAR